MFFFLKKALCFTLSIRYINFFLSSRFDIQFFKKGLIRIDQVIVRYWNVNYDYFNIERKIFRANLISFLPRSSHPFHIVSYYTKYKKYRNYFLDIICQEFWYIFYSMSKLGRKRIQFVFTIGSGSGLFFGGWIRINLSRIRNPVYR